MAIPIYFTSNPWVILNFTQVFEDDGCFDGREVKLLHLGAYSGHGTKWMLERVNGACVDVDLWTVDSPEHSSYEVKHFYSKIDFNELEAMYDSNTAGLSTTKYKGTTKSFFEQNTETFDFIYVDACHDKASVAHDLAESFKILNGGGIIACDDYLWGMELEPSLRPFEAINEFLESHSEEVEVLIKNYQLWFRKKDGAL